MRDLCKASFLALAVAMLTTTVAAPVLAGGYSISVSVDMPPPPLPVYDQPPPPAAEYIWTPGYWAWDSDAEEYYWVPGVWVVAPRPGLLWTPPWWGWEGGVYSFHPGYWASDVGYYGGIVYGFGYTGYGYEGGYWHHNHFFYNRTVNNIVNVHITNVYEKKVVINRTYVSFNGGPRGIDARPSPDQLRFMREAHIDQTRQQMSHMQQIRADENFRFSHNRGLPQIGGMTRPGDFRPMGGQGGPDRGSNRGADHAFHGAGEHPADAVRGDWGPSNNPPQQPQDHRDYRNRNDHGRPDRHAYGHNGSDDGDHHSMGDAAAMMTHGSDHQMAPAPVNHAEDRGADKKRPEKPHSEKHEKMPPAQGENSKPHREHQNN